MLKSVVNPDPSLIADTLDMRYESAVIYGRQLTTWTSRKLSGGLAWAAPMQRKQNERRRNMATEPRIMLQY